MYSNMTVASITLAALCETAYEMLFNLNSEVIIIRLTSPNAPLPMILTVSKSSLVNR